MSKRPEPAMTPLGQGQKQREALQQLKLAGALEDTVRRVGEFENAMTMVTAAVSPCPKILRYGAIGDTAEDETPAHVCGRPVENVIRRPGVRDQFRCEAHTADFEVLRATFPDMTIEPI